MMGISNIRALKPGYDEIHLLSREYPMCWAMAFYSDFEGSYDVDEVTCPECLAMVEAKPHAS
jgi:hypothetical protein